MSHALADLITERVISGLKRKSLTSCSRWACACRVMNRPYPGPWTFDHHPWLREMHDSTVELNIGQKAAQMGFTETVLNKTFFSIDVLGVDCLYVLPSTNPDASDFSAARFDPALELSPHLAKIFSEVKNVGHKRAGTTNLYIRGSRSRAGLKSVPVGFIVLDELDEMSQENIPLALERSSGQVEKSTWMVSTATIDNYGINKYFQQSSQNHFEFRCPSCSKWIELKFPESLVITGDDPNKSEVNNSYLICSQCKNTLPHSTKPSWLSTGRWVQSYTDRDSAGWYIHQLYSCTVPPGDFAKSYLRSQFDRSDEQEFYNSKLGLPHVVDGARVTDKQLDDSRGQHRLGIIETGLITMGIDVGTWIHYEIDKWYLPSAGFGPDLAVGAKCKVLAHGKVRDFEELDLLMWRFRVNFAVIDAQPERRKSKEFADRFPGHVRVCWYPNGISGKTIHETKEESSISVDRTSWLDLSLGRFRAGTIGLPMDFDQEYRAHMKALVRIYEKDKNGNPIGKYIKGNDSDHYAHARNYAEIALPLAMGLMAPQDITSVI